MQVATFERPHPFDSNGVQKLYRFDNGYGASVVRFCHSYGGMRGLWEVAVIRYEGQGIFEYELNYDTPITDDVLGYLTEDEVNQVLDQIKSIPTA